MNRFEFYGKDEVQALKSLNLARRCDRRGRPVPSPSEIFAASGVVDKRTAGSGGSMPSLTQYASSGAAITASGRGELNLERAARREACR